MLKKPKKLFNPILIVSVLTICFTSGCATGLQYHNKEVDFVIPGKWKSASDSPKEFDTDGWLDDFHDDQLRIVVKKALESNPDLLIAAERINYARNVLRIADASFAPNVSGDVRLSRSGTVAEINQKSYRQTQNKAGLHLDISWEIDVWGRLGALRESEFAEVLAAESEYESARLSYGAMAARAWISATEAGLLTELSENILKSFEKSEEVISGRFRSGLSGAMDVRLIRAEKLSAQDVYLDQKKTYSESVRVLKVVMGEYPVHEMDLPRQLPVLEKPVPKGIPSDLLKRRPDIAAARNRVISADFRTIAAEKALFPSITLTSGTGTSSSELKNLLSADSLSWNIGSGLLMPIFQGGKLREEIQKSSTAAKELWLNYQKTVLNAFHEVETAIDAESALEKREKIIRELVTETKASLDKAWDSYLAGNSEIMAVLDSKRSLIQAQKNLIAISALRLRNRIDLYLALGGGLKNQDMKY